MYPYTATSNPYASASYASNPYANYYGSQQSAYSNPYGAYQQAASNPYAGYGNYGYGGYGYGQQSQGYGYTDPYAQQQPQQTPAPAPAPEPSAPAQSQLPPGLEEIFKQQAAFPPEAPAAKPAESSGGLLDTIITWGTRALAVVGLGGLLNVGGVLDWFNNKNAKGNGSGLKVVGTADDEKSVHEVKIGDKTINVKADDNGVLQEYTGPVTPPEGSADPVEGATDGDTPPAEETKEGDGHTH